ncbi:hypothetical protein GBAR_LOCUS2129, partial [Geodia barretti]
SPTEVVAALDTLTIEKTKELFFHLKVRLETLHDIDTSHTGNMRKIYYVQAWFDQEAGASWEKIVAALKNIGRDALAEILSTRHLTPFNLTSDPPVRAPEASGPQTSGSTVTDQPAKKLIGVLQDLVTKNESMQRELAEVQHQLKHK